MRIVIAGASGLIGHTLVAALRQEHHEVLRLVRTREAAEDAVYWNPVRGTVEGSFDRVDAVVNLAGENIGAGRWTSERQQRILKSRIDATRTLVTVLNGATPAPRVLINASAVGCYGDRGDELLTEGSELGTGFLADVCRAWEAEAAKAEALGARVMMMRLGVVLGRDGGALARMLPLFRWGVGCRLGAGRQWMSWVHVDDVTGVVLRALVEESLTGACNVAAPNPVTNAVFTRELGLALRRPAVVPAPGWALRLAFGQMADEALLASTRAVPNLLLRRGYAFRFPHLGPALLDLVGGAPRSMARA